MCLCRWIQHSFQYLSGDFSLAASNGGIVWKFRSANCLRISRPLKQLLKVSAVPISRIAVWKFFWKLLSNYLWRSLYIVKFHDFSIFFWTPLEGFVWSLIRLFFEMHLILCIQTTSTLQEPHCKIFWWNYNENEGCKSYLGNKEQKWTFLHVSRSNMHTDVDSARPIGRPSKIARPKNRARRSKFLQPW